MSLRASSPGSPRCPGGNCQPFAGKWDGEGGRGGPHLNPAHVPLAAPAPSSAGSWSCRATAELWDAFSTFQGCVVGLEPGTASKNTPRAVKRLLQGRVWATSLVLNLISLQREEPKNALGRFSTIFHLR